jgi:hypothetical protein
MVKCVDNFPTKTLPAWGLSGNIPSVKQGKTVQHKNQPANVAFGAGVRVINVIGQTGLM